MLCPHCSKELSREDVARMPLQFAPLAKGPKTALLRHFGERNAEPPTVGDVAAMTDEDIYVVRGLGQTYRAALLEFLGETGLRPSAPAPCSWHGKPEVRRKSRPTDQFCACVPKPTMVGPGLTCPNCSKPLHVENDL